MKTRHNSFNKNINYTCIMYVLMQLFVAPVCCISDIHLDDDYHFFQNHLKFTVSCCIKYDYDLVNLYPPLFCWRERDGV